MIEAFKNGFSLTGKAFGFLSSEMRGMHAAAYVLAASALISSVLALGRDRLLAHTFGASGDLDLYYAAFRIPDLLFVLLGSLVSVYVLIPALAARDEETQRRYIDTVVGGFSLFVLVASIVACALTPFLLALFFPQLAVGPMSSTLITLTRILLLQPILLGFSNVVAAITQFRHRYMLYAASPIVYNLGIIAGILFLQPSIGIVGVACGVVVGASLHLLIQVPSARKDGFFHTFPRFTEKNAFFNTIRISLPRALALSMNQLMFLGLLALASGLAAGSISVFMFAFNLMSVPLAVIGASYSVAAFPTLATAFSRGERDVFLAQVHVAARQILFWSIPAALLLIVLRAHIVRVVLGTGAFDWTDTRLTAAALALFAISIVAQGITLLIVRASYASGKTLAPFVISAVTALLSLSLGVVFLQMFQHVQTAVFLQELLRVGDVPGSDMLALILAYSASTMIGALLLIGYFELSFGSFFSDVARAWWESLTAALLGALAAYSVLHILGDITLSSTLASVAFKGFCAGVCGVLATALVYYLLGSREFGEAVQTFRRRIWREVEPVSSAE